MAAFSANWRAANRRWPQVTCRPLTFQMNLKDPFTFNMRPAFKALMDTPLEERLAAYNGPAWRARAEAERRHDAPAMAGDDDRAREEGLVGRSVADVAEERLGAVRRADRALGRRTQPRVAARFC